MCQNIPLGAWRICELTTKTAAKHFFSLSAVTKNDTPELKTTTSTSYSVSFQDSPDPLLRNLVMVELEELLSYATEFKL